MELKEGKTYTLDEIRKFFGISINQWKRNRKNYLDHLLVYYEFEEIKDPKDRRKTLIKINKKIKDYEPLLSKAEKNRIIIKNKILNILSENNIQTGASLLRIMMKDEDIIKLCYKESTLQSYIYRAIDELKESRKIIVLKKEWIGIDDNKNYIELNDNQREELISLFKKFYNKDNITITSYNDVSNLFVMSTELWPIKAPVYEIGAF